MVGVLGSVPTPMVFFFPDCPSIAPDPVSPNPYPLRACMPHAPARLALLPRKLFLPSPSIFDSPFFFSYGGEPPVDEAACCKRQTLFEPPLFIPSPRCVRLGRCTLIAIPTRGLLPSHHSYT